MLLSLLQLAMLWSLPTATSAEHAIVAAAAATAFGFALPEQTLWRPRMSPMTDGPMHPMQTPFLNIRQASSPGQCAIANQFPCSAIGLVSSCCPSSEYCYIDSSNEGRCCQSGIRCANDPCESGSYLCSPSATTSCCKRLCPQTAYLCPTSLGGNCCDIGSACLSGATCKAISTVFLTTVCGAGQHSCPESLSGGCCPNDYVCTQVSGTDGCASVTGSSAFFGSVSQTTGVASTTSGIAATPAHASSGGLSTGSKAGIGIGAAIGFLALLGILFLLNKRSRTTKTIVPPSVAGVGRRTDASSTMYEFPQGTPNIAIASYLQPGSPYSTEGSTQNQYPFTSQGPASPPHGGHITPGSAYASSMAGSDYMAHGRSYSGNTISQSTYGHNRQLTGSSIDHANDIGQNLPVPGTPLVTQIRQELE